MVSKLVGILFKQVFQIFNFQRYCSLTPYRKVNLKRLLKYVLFTFDLGFDNCVWYDHLLVNPNPLVILAKNLPVYIKGNLTPKWS